MSNLIERKIKATQVVMKVFKKPASDDLSLSLHLHPLPPGSCTAPGTTST
jgi:hypothetical protein